MKVLIIGSGGREHAIAHKLSMSHKNPELFVAPGNAGLSKLATCVPIAVDDLDGLLAFALKERIDLTVVGPELPLVLGIVDLFEAEGLRIFGPTAKAAQFEGSKAFTKDFLNRYDIPTAKSATYTSLNEALEGLKAFDYPVVIKADGLAAGKGVIIAETQSVAIKTLHDLMADCVFGDAGTTVVLEAFLNGIEASILCFVDGKTIVPMSPAQDYKKAYDGDLGLNTGGMGTYSPSRVIDDAFMQKIQETILNPFIVGIQKEAIDFKGILFVGLMINKDAVHVIEYNVRLGDPETEVTLIRMENDLLDVIEAVFNQTLDTVKLTWSKSHAVCVIMASKGYPESYEKGKIIHGLDQLSGDGWVYHCGTRFNDSDVVTDGGRVLGVTAIGEDLASARTAAYHMASQITFEGAQFRTDIAKMNA